MSEPISYVGREAAKRIVSKAKEKFAPINHKHLKSDITDLIIDSELSSTSTNPVQNKVLDAEFKALNNSINELEPSDIGLGNVENKSSATIRSEITKDNVVGALGYDPAEETGTKVSIVRWS